jgi:serine/threonine-protein kinase RsbW
MQGGRGIAPMAASFARTLPATHAELPGLIEAIESWAEEAGLPANHAAPLMIALDEILSNIVKYGGDTLSIAVEADGKAYSVTITDDGPAFDPLARPEPDVSLDVDEREIGGLGIHLVRKMMDDVGYSHENGRNRLTFRKTF